MRICETNSNRHSKAEMSVKLNCISHTNMTAVYNGCCIHSVLSTALSALLSKVPRKAWPVQCKGAESSEMQGVIAKQGAVLVLQVEGSIQELEERNV
jgi:hypothetical protein